MIQKKIIKLLPTPCESVHLHGLYLSHHLHRHCSSDNPMVYANFLSSVDGRIAVIDPATHLSATPESITSIEDFRLFQELQAQSDCMITHGGYLRSLANGQLGNILQVGLREEAKDLVEWRNNNGLSAQPDLVIASSSLDFTIPASLAEHNQQVLIVTDSRANQQRIKRWRQRGYTVVVAGDEMVDGGQLIQLLSQRGYKSIYLIAGPQMLATMISNQVLQRLYLTTSHQLLGGEQFHTLIPGSIQPARGRLTLIQHHYDALSSNHHGQCYSCYEVIYNKIHQ